MYKNSNFILWEHTSSATKLVWGRLLRPRKEIWVRNVRLFSRTSHVLGIAFTNDCRDLDAISEFDSKILTSCLLGNCWLLVCWLEEEWLLSAMFLHQRFGKYLTVSWYRAEKNDENACGIKIVFLSDVLEAEYLFWNIQRLLFSLALLHNLVIKEESHYVWGMDLANRGISFSPFLHPFTGCVTSLKVWQTFPSASTQLTSEQLLQRSIPTAVCHQWLCPGLPVSAEPSMVYHQPGELLWAQMTWLFLIQVLPLPD